MTETSLSSDSPLPRLGPRIRLTNYHGFGLRRIRSSACRYDPPSSVGYRGSCTCAKSSSGGFRFDNRCTIFRAECRTPAGDETRVLWTEWSGYESLVFALGNCSHDRAVTLEPAGQDSHSDHPATGDWLAHPHHPSVLEGFRRPGPRTA